MQNSPQTLGGMEPLWLIWMKPSLISHCSVQMGSTGGTLRAKPIFAQTPVFEILVFQAHNSISVWEFL